MLALAPSLASALSIASPSLYTCQLTGYQVQCANGPCNIHLRDASSQQEIWSKTNVPSGTFTISWEPNVPAVSGVIAKNNPIVSNSDASGVSANNDATVVASGSSDCNIIGGDDSAHIGGSGAPFTLPTGTNQDNYDSSEDSSDSEYVHGDSNLLSSSGQSRTLQSSTSSYGSNYHASSATSLSATPSMVLKGSLVVIVMTSMIFGAALLA
ncbi:BQ2448_6675 [Microbotryum intermedium]|uniref:BQ2448_6675 protein n=1 Tax=Microbotryum intermedium TaxID=269621 RepID=A0A238FQG8_9BASI|nr:BQ2448_6675 [Microbotryum intermedium]